MKFGSIGGRGSSRGGSGAGALLRGMRLHRRLEARELERDLAAVARGQLRRLRVERLSGDRSHGPRVSPRRRARHGGRRAAPSTAKRQAPAGAEESPPEERSLAATTTAATPVPTMIGIRLTSGVFLATL